MDFDIRGRVMGGGLDNLSKMGTALAKGIETTDAMNQVDMLKLQQQMATYNNTVSMMSNLLKNLNDTDKEVIRAM